MLEVTSSRSAHVGLIKSTSVKPLFLARVHFPASAVKTVPPCVIKTSVQAPT
jgi:hypothetical protein